MKMSEAWLQSNSVRQSWNLFGCRFRSWECQMAGMLLYTALSLQL